LAEQKKSLRDVLIAHGSERRDTVLSLCDSEVEHKAANLQTPPPLSLSLFAAAWNSATSIHVLVSPPLHGTDTRRARNYAKLHTYSIYYGDTDELRRIPWSVRFMDRVIYKQNLL